MLLRRLPGTFSEHLATLPDAKLLSVANDYFTFKNAEREWQLAHPAIKRAMSKPNVRRKNLCSTVRHRLSVGTAFLRWRSTEEGGASSAPLKDFAAKISLGESGGIPKHERVWLARCVTLARPVVKGKEVSPDDSGKKLVFAGAANMNWCPQSC